MSSSVNAQTEGFDFLGYRFVHGTRWPRPKSLGKFKDTIRGKTRRTQGQSLSAIIADVNRTVRGWFEYYKHSRRFTFDFLDSWVRMRLRSLLRRRHGRRGREVAGRTISAGLMPSLPSLGCSLWSLPLLRSVHPLGGKTTDWRAGCGRPAGPVRREGGPGPLGPPYPYLISFTPSGQLLPLCDAGTLTRPWGCPYFGDSQNFFTLRVPQKVWNMLRPYLGDCS